MNKGRAVKLALYVFFLSAWTLGSLSAEEDSGEKEVRWVKSKTGVKSLMTFSKDRNAMIKEYNEETADYDKIKSALENGHLEVGEKARTIAKRYGNPVVVVPESGGDIVRWVYKPGDESFFRGSKVYLFFDRSERLMDWKEIPGAKE